MQTLSRLIRRILLAPLVFILLFEEWGWAPLSRAFGWLARLPLWARLESAITRLPPWAALLVFGVPVVSLVPVKLLALYLFAQGHALSGLVLIISAKVIGTATAARLFELTQPALMQMHWFAGVYVPFKRWKDIVLKEIRNSLAWRFVSRFNMRSKEFAIQMWQGIKRK